MSEAVEARPRAYKPASEIAREQADADAAFEAWLAEVAETGEYDDFLDEVEELAPRG